jgi:putative CocE/NonD family hydrolase
MSHLRCFATACAIVLTVATHAAPLAPSGFGHPLPVATNETVRSSSYITMPDGTRLAADIYRPAKDGATLPGTFPVILHATASRTRLGDTEERSGTGKFSTQMINLANHGYVFVAVERRGIAASFGVRRGYHDRIEAQDSQDLITWAAQQSWSNGKVGGYGCSNTGDAAMHFLTLPSPHLKAVFAGCFNWDKYSGGMRGGVLANWGTGPQGSMERDMASTPVDGDESKVLLRQAAEQHAANTIMLDLWSGMPYRDSVSPLTGTAFWEEGSIGTYVDQVRKSNIPLYVQAGWKDDFRSQSFIVLANLPQAKLIIGPWGHCDSGDFSMTAEALRFFDYWLKNVKNGIMDEPRIHYTTDNVSVSNTWRGAANWPLVSAQETTLYLGAHVSARNYGFSQHKGAVGAKPASFQVDYNAVCARGTALGPTCPQDDKGITFTSAPLTADLEVTGMPLLDLWVSSTATDGPLFAYLEDVAPDGGIVMVSEGRLRASLRTINPAPYKLPSGMVWHGFYKADAKPLVPGMPVQMTFELMPVSHIFKSGHRYRLTLTGADPRERLRKQADPVPTWTIYTSAHHASRFVLPLVQP